MESARNSHSTAGAVTILENNSSNESSSHSDKHFKIKVITSCANSPLPGHDADAVTSTIHVKPLLVLDMNGIMCHRIRIHKECPSVAPNNPKMFFRPVIGFIASTNIVPRPNLESFLEYLATHFCLAVWTSAKAKNARLLINAIFPPSISKRLFVVCLGSK
jgi:NLI interacting factor-like phosphatase